MTRFRWDEIPYPGEKYGPKGEAEDSGSWPLKFFKRDDRGNFYDLENNKVSFEIKYPSDQDDFQGKQLAELKNINKNLTSEQKLIADYWQSSNPAILHFKNVMILLETYQLSTMNSARILSVMGDVFYDAMAICFYYKYKFQIPRAVQLDPNFKSYLKAGYDPSYPVGHGVLAGAVEEVLSYFFPMEKDKLKIIAEESSMSRVYGGIHYNLDVEQGLRLGRNIGRIIINTIKKDVNSLGCSIDIISTEYKNAKLQLLDY